MTDIHTFLRDSRYATHRQGLDKEPVAYMGERAFYRLLASITPSCPEVPDAEVKTVGGVRVYLIREDPDYYHMTFRRAAK